MTNDFTAMNLSPQLMRGLETMKFTAPTHVQAAAIGPMLAGGDLLVQAPTGTGKTCAFGIPVVELTEPNNRQIQTVILCPTRELAIQSANVLKSLTAFKPGVRVQAIYGGESIQRQIVALRRKPQIVVATPGRLMDHMNRRTIRLGTVCRVVLDEADRMLDMGFRDDIDTILRSVPEERQTVLFSATLSAEVKRIAARFQRDAESIQVEANNPAQHRVEQFYSRLQSRDKVPALLELLQKEKFGLTLVFVATKSMADRLAARLGERGYRADALHGDLRQSQRDAVMDRYRRGRTSVLVATDVAARGIDVQNIDAVINYDIPLDADSYTHRIGRTGRADKAGAAYTFVSPQECGKLMSFAAKSRGKLQILELSQSCAEGAGWTGIPPANGQGKSGWSGRSGQGKSGWSGKSKGYGRSKQGYNRSKRGAAQASA